MPATEQIPASVAELRSAHEARLRVLRLRAARAGNDTPPEVLTEIEDIERKLRDLAETVQAVAQSPVAPDVADALGPIGRHQLTMSHIMRLDGDLIACKRELERLRPWIIIGSIGAVCGAIALILSVVVLVKVY